MWGGLPNGLHIGSGRQEPVFCDQRDSVMNGCGRDDAVGRIRMEIIECVGTNHNGWRDRQDVQPVHIGHLLHPVLQRLVDPDLSLADEDGRFHAGHHRYSDALGS